MENTTATTRSSLIVVSMCDAVRFGRRSIVGSPNRVCDRVRSRGLLQPVCRNQFGAGLLNKRNASMLICSCIVNWQS
jgi:hypothetical protein